VESEEQQLVSALPYDVDRGHTSLLFKMKRSLET
jgi:hypothetical protein